MQERLEEMNKYKVELKNGEIREVEADYYDYKEEFLAFLRV